MRLEIGADPLHRGTGGAIYDAAFAAASGNQTAQLATAFLRLKHVEKEVWPVKSGDHTKRILQSQNLCDIFAHCFRGGGGKGGQHGTTGKLGEKFTDFQVTGPEILPH